MPSKHLNHQSTPKLGDFILDAELLRDPEVFLKFLRDSPDGFSRANDISGSASLLRQRQELFTNPHLDEIAAYCARLIPKLILNNGCHIQIQELAVLAAQVVIIQRERSEVSK